MPTTTAAAAVPPTSAAVKPQSPTGSDSDEYEYEEVEIEEEIEVEEEVSDDDDEDEEEFEEEFEEDDAAPSIENLNDEKGKETIITVEEAPQCDGEVMSADEHNSFIEASKEVTVEEAPQCDGEVVSTEAHKPFNDTSKEVTVEEAPQCDGELMSADTRNPFVEASKEVTGGGDSIMNINESSDIPLVEQTMQMSAKDVNDAQQKEPRLDVSLIRPRSLSPAVETNEENKRPALICDFFAKGWCIKGNSCRFRHIKDLVNVGDQQNKSYVAASQKSEPQDGEDGEGLATSAAATTITCTSEMIELQKSKESPMRKVNTEPQKEYSVTISPSNDVGMKGMLENQNLDKDKPRVNADSSLNETSRSNPFMASDIPRSNLVSSYGASIEKHSGRGHQHGFHNHKFPTTNYPLNYSSSSFQPTTRISPSNHSPVWPGPSTFLTSPFSGSESERLYRTKEVRPHSAGFSEFSTYNWEPSRPFRSAFLISQGISTPDIQYDPIRDSIEPPKIVDKAPKFPSSSKAPSISSTHSAQNINPLLKETCGKDYGSDRFFLASHVNGKDNDHDNDMDVDSNECELFTSKKSENTKGEGKEKMHSTPAPVADIVQASEVRVSHYSLGQNDVPARESKVGDESSQHHKPLFDPEGDMNRESKALRHFRAALIEFVKELVKPTWRDGKLSKDAHKMVVKKAVDKVLSTLPPEHIPSIQESVDMYLSSSKSKLTKLVEGYIEKYGKL